MVNLTVDLDDDMARRLEDAARAYHLAPEELLRQLVWEHLAARQPEDSYDAWLLRTTRESMRQAEAGKVHPHEKVEAYFAARRAETLRRLEEDAWRSSGPMKP